MGQYGNCKTEIKTQHTSTHDSTKISEKQRRTIKLDSTKISEKQIRAIKLDSLPTEVVHGILRYLDTRALREVSRTNRRMYRLVDGASLVWSRTLWVEFGVRLSDL